MFKGLFKKNKVPLQPRSERGVPSGGTFGRNRTITGTSSENFEAAAHNRSADLQSDRSRAQQLFAKRRKVGLLLVGIVSMTGLMLVVLTQFTASVSVGLSDSGLSKSVDTAIYSQRINDYLNANPLERFRFATDSDKLLRYLNVDNAEVSSVDRLDMNGLGGSSFVLSMRKPVASWVIDGSKYFVDEQGVAFSQNFFGGSVVSIVDESGISVEGGSVVASNRFLSFVGRVVSSAKSMKYTVEEAIIPDGTTRELDIKLKGVSSRVKLSVDRPAGEQVEDMVRAIKFLKSKGRSPSYIDVRVSGKAFYI